MVSRSISILLKSFPCILFGLTLAGCSSLGGSGTSSFASVTIQNRPPEEIAAATAQVFAADGYRGGVNGPGRMVFEKEASRGTSLAREGIVGAFYGAQTINRVEVEFMLASRGTYRLQCNAFMITGGSDPFFQDKVPVSHFRSGPYQELLNKVAKQLKGTP